MKINKFAFYVMGEDSEKKNEDLAEEVAKQVDSMKKVNQKKLSLLKRGSFLRI